MPHTGEVFITFISIVILLLALLAFFIFFLMLHQRRKFEHLCEVQELQRARDQEIAKAELEIKEQTLQDVSRELHDNFGQAMSVSLLYLEGLDNTKDAADFKNKLQETKTILSTMMTDLRSLSHSLHGEQVRQRGLLESLKLELLRIGKSDVIHTELNVSGDADLLTDDQQVVAFRLVQETLNNAMKHAQCSLIKIKAESTASVFRLEVQDNGRGFDPNKMSEGTGMINLKRRASLIGAELEVNSNPGEGTSVIITWNNK